MPGHKLCLLDGNSLFYRAFYAIKSGLRTSSGQPTNAVFGFVKMVRRLLEDIEPDYLAVCFDVGRATHRTKKFSDYKAHRKPMPDDLVAQLPLIKEYVESCRFRSFGVQGYEADDLIATLTHRFKDRMDRVVIVSSDKDILQLVQDRVDVYNPYKEGGLVFTPGLVAEKFGVQPGQISDLIALMGDASDNIPGVKGVGEKTAVELIREFVSTENLIRRRKEVKRAVVQNLLETHLEDLKLSKDLALLCHEVPLDVGLDDLRLQEPDRERLHDLFARLEFKGMLKDLAQDVGRVSSSAPLLQSVAIASPQDLDAVAQGGSVFSFFIHEEDMNESRLRVNLNFGSEKVYEVKDGAVLKSLFSRAGVKAVAYDIKSLRHFLSRQGLVLEMPCFDVMLAAYLLESSKASLGLENLVWNRLGLYGLDRSQWLGRESYYLLKLADNLSQALRQNQLLRLFEDVEMPLSCVLCEMEAVGVGLDIDLLGDFSKELELKVRDLVARIFVLAGCEFNVNSPKQLSQVLFEKLKLPVIKKTKTGISTDEEVLTKLSDEHELARLLLEYRQITKLKTTYVDALPELARESSGRIHTNFNQTGTETGRLSSNSPNLQNIPIKTEMGRRIRQAFVATDGFDLLLSADYSQIELRLLAHLSADKALIEAFAQDRDIHRTTASLIFSVREDEVSEQMRENAKRVNFGIVYGMSAYGLAKDLGISPAQAQDFIDAYFLRYPTVGAYLESRIKECRETGFVSTILGRRRVIPEISNANTAVRQFAERQAINAPIQGSAADLIKMAMVNIARLLSEKKFISRLILQVHDELVFEVKKEEAKALAQLVKTEMESAMRLSVPLKVKVRSGRNWLDLQEG